MFRGWRERIRRRVHGSGTGTSPPENGTALDQSASLLVATFEQAPVGLAIIDRDLRYVRVNDRFTALSPLGENRFVGRLVAEVIQELPNRDEILDRMRRALAGETIVITVSEPPTRTPRQHYAIGYHPLRDADGAVSAIVTQVQLVTREKETADALAHSEAQYRTLVELSGQLVWSLRTDGTVDFANRHCIEYTGLDKEQVSSGQWLALVHPEDRGRLTKMRREAIAAGAPYTQQVRLRRADGVYRWFLTHASPVLDSDGKVLRYIGVSSDIDDQHKLESARARYQLLSRYSRDPIFFVRPETGDIIEANDAACATYGYSRETLLAMNRSAIRAPGALGDFASRLQEAVGGGTTFETMHIRSDGTTFPAEVSAAGATVDGEKLVISSVRDISARRRAEQERADNERFREMFVGVLGHDLRTPLQAIVTSAEIMLLDEDLTVQQAVGLRRIVAASDRMTRMITQVLDLTRARLGGGIPVTPVPLRLGGVIGGVVEEVRAAHRDVVLEQRSDGDDRGRWDPDRLHHVFQNLVENAVGHGIAGQPITVTIRGDGERVRVTVHNHGAPIDPSALPHLFDPFRHEARSARADGLGLGLYIAHELVRAHEGTIEVTSTADAGTTFDVTLPRQRARAEPPSPERATK